MDFIFDLPRDAEGRTGVLVFVDRFSKMVHLAPVAAEVTADESAELFLDLVFRHHGLPESIVSDRDPRFTSAFWTRLFALLGTRLLMSTAAHPETDGQTERVNRVLEDVLRSYATSFASWSSFLPMAEFALNNSTHASTGLTPFFVNNARHPRVPALLAVRSSNAVAVSTLGGGGMAPTSKSAQDSSEPLLPQSAKPNTRDATLEGHALHGVAYEDLFAVDVASPAASAVANFAPAATPTPIESAAVSEFLLHRKAVTRFVHDALQAAVDRHKANADRRGRKNMSFFRRGERVRLSTDGIQGTAVTNLGANKLAPRFIGPFKILKVIGDAYTLDIPTAMRLHPTFYVGRLKLYVPATIPAPEAERPRPARNPNRPAVDADAESARALAPHARASPSVTRATPSDEATSPSRAAPAPIESQQSSQPQYARAQDQRGSEPPSRRPSPDPSSARSSGVRVTCRFGATKPLDSRRNRRNCRNRRPFRVVALKRRPAPTRQPFAEMVRPRLSMRQALGAGLPRASWIARRALDTASASRRARATETYYRVRWLGFQPAEDTWEPRKRLMEDIPDIVKEYEATLALISDDDGSEDDHDLVSAIAHEYSRRESPGNDDATATGISDEAPANSRDVNSRDTNSRDLSDDDHATRSVDMDVSTATTSATRSAARSTMLPSACTCIAHA
ncbi:hypothetical protein PF010_g24017 [Phytophthora fragariae]|nr:hypothetical protein PF003_g35554 [Phytophthora fragariae]KAE9076149.1 hypothetical protein PF010_g24017 [Phytophthora fragariae]KAE9274050.1 hypothetical protein PF001_g27231 [Phytophthora fragariae]